MEQGLKQVVAKAVLISILLGRRDRPQGAAPVELLGGSSAPPVPTPLDSIHM